MVLSIFDKLSIEISAIKVLDVIFLKCERMLQNLVKFISKILENGSHNEVSVVL